MKNHSSLSELIHRIKALSIGDYSNPLAFSTIISDTEILKNIEALYQQLEGDTITDIVLCGIGGSHFGVQALYDALYGNPYHQPKVTFHALTSVDSFTLPWFVSWYTGLLQDTKRRIFTFVVSKTGATFETACHASLCYDLLKKYQPDSYHKNICIITDKDSPLWNKAGEEKLPALSIPKKIGGRYSIFSTAGLGVLHFLKIDIAQLVRGAQSVDLEAPVNSAQEYVAYLNQGFTIQDIFIFMPQYASLGGWLRQLLGESLGKEGKGYVPTVSLGSQDLHSVVQCYFAGPQIAVTTFIIPQGKHEPLQVPNTLFSECATLPKKLTYAEIQHAIIQGVLSSYKQANKPFFITELEKDSVYDIGAFMQYKMLETVYIGTLLGINPFDQPQVELYKKETRKLLSSLS